MPRFVNCQVSFRTNHSLKIESKQYLRDVFVLDSDRILFLKLSSVQTKKHSSPFVKFCYKCFWHPIHIDIIKFVGKNLALKLFKKR